MKMARNALYIAVIGSLVALSGCDRAPADAHAGVASRSETSLASDTSIKRSNSVGHKTSTDISRPVQTVILEAVDQGAVRSGDWGSVVRAFCDPTSRQKVHEEYLKEVAQVKDKRKRAKGIANIRGWYANPDLTCLYSIAYRMQKPLGGWPEEVAAHRPAREDWLRWRIAAGRVLADDYEQVAASLIQHPMTPADAAATAERAIEVASKGFWAQVESVHAQEAARDITANQAGDAGAAGYDSDGYRYEQTIDGWKLTHDGIALYSPQQIWGSDYSIRFSGERGGNISRDVNTQASVKSGSTGDLKTNTGAAQ